MESDNGSPQQAIMNAWTVKQISANIMRLNLTQKSSPGSTIDEQFQKLLVDSQRVTPERMQSLIEKSGGSQEEFEHLLLKEGSLTVDQAAVLKAFAHNWHFVNLDIEPVTTAVMQLLPQTVAQTQGALVFKQGDDGTHVALLHPERGAFRRLLQKKFRGGIHYSLATKQSLHNAIAKYDISFEERFTALQNRAAKGHSGDAKDEPVIALVDMMLQHALRSGASDVHIEPQAKEAIVRERVDGLLRTTAHIPKNVHAHMVLRLKVMANLATDEHAIPQDGKLSYIGEGTKIDVRLSVVPTTRGEKVVLRLLVGSDEVLPLDALGLGLKDQEMLRSEMKRSWGMILVTGPTGSGKTTTLYTIMRQLQSEAINISTIEDPVEYELPGANQIQVNDKVGLTFASGLRSIVRQDPNIILVGEIRDHETASIAVDSAMTGHLVLSTLHTNDAPTAVPRLIDMGIEPFLIASTVNVVIAQRLVRKICIHCRESLDVNHETLASICPPDILPRINKDGSSVRLYRGKGCNVCHGSGFKGRIGIYEIVLIDTDIRALILQRASADTIHKLVQDRGGKSMLDDGITKALQGITTLQDVLRVIRS